MEEIKPGWLIVTTNVLLESNGNLSVIELWFKERVGEEEAEATDDDLRDFGLGQFADIDESEDKSDDQGDSDGELEGDAWC